MQVWPWGNSLAVRLPKAVVESLGLKPGDQLEIVSTHAGHMVIARDKSETTRQAVLAGGVISVVNLQPLVA